MSVKLEITELTEVIMFGAGCLDINNCSLETASTEQLSAVEGYCKGGANSGGIYGECGVKKTCK